MCGIVGKVYFDGKRRVTEAEITRMCQAVKHRGPDDRGVVALGNVGLGNRRLAVIDLSPSGHQPMSTPDKKVWITFNGEIHNFLELRKLLEKQGVRFRTHTDTEVILALYQKYGEGCLKYLRGQFAFAIWDEKKQQLFAARDRLGINPFKYFYDGKRFLFASELKAILTDTTVPREPDLEAIDEYLTYQFVPSPKTGFKGIAKLPAAHYLTLKDGKLSIRRYWNLSYKEKDDLSEEEWVERIRDKINEAVKLRMISDAPLGAFLSGGVDSSAVVAFMSRNSSRPVKTFSIGFKEEKFNELPYARVVAKHFGTDHRELIVEPHALEVLPKLVWHYEEPYADSSAINAYYVSQATREHVTVALNGDGGDENFAGYPWYTVHRLAAIYDRIPTGIRERVVRPMLLAAISKNHSPLGRRGRIFLEHKEDSARRYSTYFVYFTQEEKDRLYSDAMRGIKERYDARDFIGKLYESADAGDPVDRATWTDIMSYLPDDLLVKVDIASMAHGLEARPPLLDHELVELTARIPSNLKERFGQRKYIFKKALRGILPSTTLTRKKVGFGLPVDDWFRGELADFSRDTLLSKTATSRHLFEKKTIEQILNEHQSGINHGIRIWALLTLELWFREYFD
jgi:asparagine synthase (glutamine-hydrolysing)